MGRAPAVAKYRPWGFGLDNPEPLSFGKIQEVVQVDIGVEQNVHGGHEI